MFSTNDGFSIRMEHDPNGLANADIEFYGVIGEDIFLPDDDFVNVPRVLRALRDMGSVNRLTINMNSPGGDAFGAIQIANRLDKLKAEGKVKAITTHAEGIVASAATLVFLRGDTRIMRQGSRFMIHNPWSFGAGTAKDFREYAEQLEQTQNDVIDIYEEISTLTRTEIEMAMEAETYYTGPEAAAIGFATETVAPFAVAACVSRGFRDRYLRKMPTDVKIQEPRARFVPDPSLSIDDYDDMDVPPQHRNDPRHPSNWDRP